MGLGSSARSLFGPGLGSALAKMRDEMRIASAHRKSVRKAKQLPSAGLRLNCGCGPHPKSGWVNIDALNAAADLHLDLRRPLPFQDGSAVAIYSEHFFEHLEYPAETGTFLAESLRVLGPNGSFRVGVPDTEWPIRAYVNGDEQYFTFARQHWHPTWCDTRMHNINYHFRQGTEHKYAYDYETLEKILIDAGFASVTCVDFDPAIDSESRRLGTLYAEARKGLGGPRSGS
jgi:predicted SAM-dependent methyltransferase